MPKTQQSKGKKIQEREKKNASEEQAQIQEGKQELIQKRIVETKKERKTETLTLSQKRKHAQCYVKLKTKPKSTKKNSHIERSINKKERRN